MAYGTARVVARAESAARAESLVRNYINDAIEYAVSIGQTLTWLPVEYDDETERFGRIDAGDA